MHPKRLKFLLWFGAAAHTNQMPTMHSHRHHSDAIAGWHGRAHGPRTRRLHGHWCLQPTSICLSLGIIMPNMVEHVVEVGNAWTSRPNSAIRFSINTAIIMRKNGVGICSSHLPIFSTQTHHARSGDGGQPVITKRPMSQYLTAQELWLTTIQICNPFRGISQVLLSQCWG